MYIAHKRCNAREHVPACSQQVLDFADEPAIPRVARPLPASRRGKSRYFPQGMKLLLGMKAREKQRQQQEASRGT